MTVSDVRLSVEHPLYGRVLELIDSSDPGARDQLRDLLRGAGLSEGDVIRARDSVPKAGEVSLPLPEPYASPGSAYRVVHDVMVIDQALPLGLAERLIRACEAHGEWAAADVVQGGAQGYTARRTSSNMAVRGTPELDHLGKVLNVLLEGAGRFYRHYNSFVPSLWIPGPWEVLRYTEGERFELHMDQIPQARRRNDRQLSLLVFLNGTTDGSGGLRFRNPAWELEIAPSVGTIVAWAPGWTHPHEGLPPSAGNTVYKVVGWLRGA